MSHSHCTKILKFFAFDSVSGNEDNFDPKERKIRNILEQGNMFSRIIMTFTQKEI